jgi:N-acetylmuramoyl-L-alanine amidase
MSAAILRFYEPRTRVSTELLVVHCSATMPTMDIGVEEIRHWHTRERGWSEVGYHYVIRRNGAIEKGRPESAIGAHVMNYNAHSIGICLVGGINKAGRAENNFPVIQMESLKQLLTQLSAKYPKAKIVGHRDLSNHKECPSFDVKKWWSASDETTKSHT